MSGNTFDLLGTSQKKSTEFSVLSVIKDTKGLIDLACEIRDGKTFLAEKEQRLMNEVERLNYLAEQNTDKEPLDDDDFCSIIPENFTKIETLYALVGIYESAKRSNTKVGLLSNNQQGESNWIAWTKSVLGDEISLTFITYLESTNKWTRFRLDLPEKSVAVFNPGLLRISLPDFNAVGKNWSIEVIGGNKIINFHRTVSNMTQRTSIGHRAMRLTGKDGFEYVPEKGRFHPDLELVFDLQLPNKERVQDILDAIMSDPLAAFGVDV